MKLRNKTTGEVMGMSMAGDIVWIGNYRYKSLARINEEWEDYNPAEPLIKDEKVREAVRSWAEVNAIKQALYAERPDRILCALTDMGDDDYSIELVGHIPTLEDGEQYTINELCGEDVK